jgi:putative phage-type endonuclease
MPQKASNNMQTVNLVQGSKEWHAHRAKYFNASDAPAMMGVSKYKTRDQLLHEIKTGLTKEVDAGTQRLFDDGHKFEALARPVAEKIIGDELSPTVGVNDKYSASFDGITFASDVIFEHKTLNEELREFFGSNDGYAQTLPIMYRVQMEQQLMISGAEKCLFMASKWNGETLLEEVHAWYYQDADLRAQIIAGWDQFAKDLETYVPPVQVEKVVAETIETLPVPSVVVKGEITQSNLNEITPLFDNYLESIKTELSNDQDFADAEANAKNCRETAKRIQALRENIIAQMVDVNTVDSALANYETAFNKIGLQLEKAVKEQKEQLKANAIMLAKSEYESHVTAAEKLSIPLRHKLQYPNFAEAIKGVKTIESMQSRINDALAKGKAEATSLLNDVSAKLAFIQEAIKDYEHLFSVNELAFNDIEFIKLKISSVKEAENLRKAEYEAQVERNIKYKAEVEARAKAEAEAQTKVSDMSDAHFQSLVTTGLAVSNVSLADNGQLTVSHIATSNVYNIMPSEQQIVECISNHFGATHQQARSWLDSLFNHK